MTTEKKSVRTRHIRCSLIDDRGLIPRNPYGRQRCGSIHTYWQNIITISESHLLTRDYVRSRAAFYNEKRRHIKSNYWYIIHPFSKFRSFWDSLMTVIYFFSFVECPLNATFFIDRLWSSSIFYWQCIRIAIDCIFMLDIIITLITGYYVYETKQLVLEPNEIFWNYFKRGRFMIDFLSALPLQGVMVLIYPRAPFTTLRMWLIVEYVSLLQLLRICKIKYALTNAIVLLEKKFHVSEICIVVIKLFFINMLMIHWLACLRHFVPKIKSYNDSENYKTSWILQENLKDSEVIKLYVTSLMETLFSYLNVYDGKEDPNNTDETILQTIILLIGYMNIWYIIICYLWVHSTKQNSSIQYDNVIQQLNDYMIHNNIPSYLQQRILVGFNHRFRNQYFRENIILSTLPENMKSDIYIYTSRRIIKRCPIFSFLSRADVEEVMQCLQSELYLPNDVILQTNVESNSMFLVNSGTVAIYGKTGEEICHLEDGDHFGEYGLLREFKYLNHDCNITAVAITITELLRLKKIDFDRLLGTKFKIVEYFQNRAENYFTRIMAQDHTGILEDDLQEYFRVYGN